MLLTIDQLCLAKKTCFLSSLRLGGYELQVMFGFRVFCQSPTAFFSRDAPKAHDQESVSILNVAMVTTAHDIPLY